MSQYAHLSKLDPEFAGWMAQNNLPAVSPMKPPVDIAAAKRGWIAHTQTPYADYEKARLPPGQ